MSLAAHIVLFFSFSLSFLSVWWSGTIWWSNINTDCNFFLRQLGVVGFIFVSTRIVVCIGQWEMFVRQRSLACKQRCADTVSISATACCTAHGRNDCGWGGQQGRNRQREPGVYGGPDPELLASCRCMRLDLLRCMEFIFMDINISLICPNRRSQCYLRFFKNLHEVEEYPCWLCRHLGLLEPGNDRHDLARRPLFIILILSNPNIGSKAGFFCGSAKTLKAHWFEGCLIWL